MSTIQKAICMLQECFCKYAGQEGDSTTMTKKEVSNMLNKEFPELSAALSGDGSGKGQQEVNELFQMLDEDGDGVVDFKEYIIFVATVCMFLNPC